MGSVCLDGHRILAEAEEVVLKYTCTEYREEMLLLSLRKQLNREGLSEKQQQEIKEEIKKLESQMEMN